MKRRVVITGIGINCCLGEGKEEVIRSLELDTIGLKKQVNHELEALREVYFGKKSKNVTMKNYEDFEKIEIMAIKTMRQALEDSNIDRTDIDQYDDRLALSLSSSLAGIDHIIKSVETDHNKGEWLIHCRRFMNLIMKEIGIGGTCYTTSSACAAGTAGVGIGFDLIRNNEIDVAIVGGVDHLSLFSIMGFYALRTLSKEICKPFDIDRDGINLGEGACFFILEELEHAIERNVPIYAEVLGYGLGNDAYHMTTPDPKGKGAKFSMNMALNEAEVEGNEKIYINAHGTATKANDSMELHAIREIFGEKNVYVSSTKSRTGHCLGAAGSLELAISLFSIMYNNVYPTLNSNLNMLTNNYIIQNKENINGFQYALSNSFAFAGNSASILIGKY